ncbi:hypothetical protein AMTRI_Chr07g28480 [Amborella trichopoda]
MDMNLDTRYTIGLELGSNSVGHGTETCTKAETPIEDYPTEVDYNDLGYCNEMEDTNDFDSDGSNKFDICQDTEDAYETIMDGPQGFEFNDNVPKEDFKSHKKTPVMKTASCIDKHMAEIYTPTIFSNCFKPKLMDVINLTLQPNCEDTYSTCYNDLFPCCNILSVNGGASLGLYEYANMVIDEACDKVAARIDMEKAFVIQASFTHNSPVYT